MELMWYSHQTCLLKFMNANSLLFCFRFKYVVSRRPRAYNTVWRSIHQAFGQPSVQCDLRRQGEGWLRPGGEVGRRAHSWESLPYHCSLIPTHIRVSLCVCNSDVELYWVQSCCKMQYLDTHGSHFNTLRSKFCNFVFYKHFTSLLLINIM